MKDAKSKSKPAAKAPVVANKKIEKKKIVTKPGSKPVPVQNSTAKAAAKPKEVAKKTSNDKKPKGK
jgi:hypothetical protein